MELFKVANNIWLEAETGTLYVRTFGKDYCEREVAYVHQIKGSESAICMSSTVYHDGTVKEAPRLGFNAWLFERVTGQSLSPAPIHDLISEAI